jgi:hypothetical protein
VCNFTGGNWHSACKLQPGDRTLDATKLAEIGTPRANYSREIELWMQLNWRKLALRMQITAGR